MTDESNLGGRRRPIAPKSFPLFLLVTVRCWLSARREIDQGNGSASRFVGDTPALQRLGANFRELAISVIEGCVDRFRHLCGDHPLSLARSLVRRMT